MLPSLAQILETEESELHKLLAMLSPVCQGEPPKPPEVCISPGDNVTSRSLANLEHALSEYGIKTRLGTTTDSSSLNILLSSWATAPHRYRELTFRDKPYLIVELHPDHLTVGPLVRPGITACGFCVQQHLRDAKPHWAAIQSQLIIRPEQKPPQALFYSAAALISQELLSLTEQRTVKITELRLHEEPRRVGTFNPHPDCYCLGFPGNVN